VTHSSGNHGQAVALAAQLNGVTAHVVVPRTTPQCKIDAIENYGGAPLHLDRGAFSTLAARFHVAEMPWQLPYALFI